MMLSRLRNCFGEVLETLQTIAADPTIDKESVTQAIGLRKKLLTYETAIVLCICVKVFNILGPITVALQRISLDLSCVKALLVSVAGSLKQLRTDEGWEATRLEIEKFAVKHSVDVS